MREHLETALFRRASDIQIAKNISLIFANLNSTTVEEEKFLHLFAFSVVGKSLLHLGEK